MFNSKVEEQAVVLKDWPQPDAGAPMPQIEAGDTSFTLRDFTSDCQTTRIRFPLCRYFLFGATNDEALNGHPLYNRGLKRYSVHEVIGSSLIRMLERRNSVHPRLDPESFLGDLKHYVFTFHNSTLECVVSEGEHWKPEIEALPAEAWVELGRLQLLMPVDDMHPLPHAELDRRQLHTPTSFRQLGTRLDSAAPGSHLAWQYPGKTAGLWRQDMLARPRPPSVRKGNRRIAATWHIRCLSQSQLQHGLTTRPLPRTLLPYEQKFIDMDAGEDNLMAYLNAVPSSNSSNELLFVIKLAGGYSLSANHVERFLLRALQTQT